MLVALWDGNTKPKAGQRKKHILWGNKNTYPRSYTLDDETDTNEYLPDELSEPPDEPEPPLRHHIGMRHAYS